MKQVILVRHAKSSWNNLALMDEERPLNERGQRDAPEMAHRLLSNNIQIDSFISSPAKRAIQTASIFAKVYSKPVSSIIQIPALYLAEPEVFEEVIINVNNSINTIALFSHNPGITSFANRLTNVRVDDMPTCSIYAIKSTILQWSDFPNSIKEFWFFDYPKNK
jgi:phosphohistidine phosphatase